MLKLFIVKDNGKFRAEIESIAIKLAANNNIRLRRETPGFREEITEI